MGDLDGRASLVLTRRALGARLAGAVLAGGFGGGATVAAVPAPDPDLRDAALRGLALAQHRGDPVTAAAARAAVARLAATDPEAAILTRLYQLLDVRPAAYWQEAALNEPPAKAEDLEVLHGAIRACQPVAFDYTDMGGTVTSRQVLPLGAGASGAGGQAAGVLRDPRRVPAILRARDDRAKPATGGFFGGSQRTFARAVGKGRRWAALAGQPRRGQRLGRRNGRREGR